MKLVILFTFYKKVKLIFNFKSFDTSCDIIIGRFWLFTVSFTSSNFNSLISIGYNSQRQNSNPNRDKRFLTINGKHNLEKFSDNNWSSKVENNELKVRIFGDFKHWFLNIETSFANKTFSKFLQSSFGGTFSTENNRLFRRVICLISDDQHLRFGFCCIKY